MTKNLTAQASISTNAPPSEVWEALTKPELVKQWMFGTTVVSNWEVGSSIIYKGEWKGKPYEDKGEILEIEPERLLVTTHYSASSGLPDTPENYHTVTYELSEEDGGTEVTITQENNRTEEEVTHSEQNWKMVLESLKKLLEK